MRRLKLIKLFLSILWRKWYYVGIDDKKTAPRISLRTAIDVIKIWW